MKPSVVRVERRMKPAPNASSMPGSIPRACLVHEMDPKWAEYAGRTRDGWAKMLDLIDASSTNEGDR